MVVWVDVTTICTGLLWMCKTPYTDLASQWLLHISALSRCTVVGLATWGIFDTERHWSRIFGSGGDTYPFLAQQILWMRVAKSIKEWQSVIIHKLIQRKLGLRRRGPAGKATLCRAATWSLKSPKVPFLNTWSLMSLNLKKWSLKSLFQLSSNVQRRETAKATNNIQKTGR